MARRVEQAPLAIQGETPEGPRRHGANDMADLGGAPPPAVPEMEDLAAGVVGVMDIQAPAPQARGAGVRHRADRGALLLPEGDLLAGAIGHEQTAAVVAEGLVEGS